jgi:hypothetical protein
MKDQITALAEAIRVAQLELGRHRERGSGATSEATLVRLENLLCDPKVNEALALFAPADPSPSMVPDLPWRRTVKH